MKAVIYARFSAVENFIQSQTSLRWKPIGKSAKSIVEKQVNPIAEYGTSLFKEFSE